MAANSGLILTGAVLRAARALIEVSAAELAAESGVGQRTILRAEKHDGPVKMRGANHDALTQALGRRGVVLIASDADLGPGLRLTEPKKRGET